MHQKSKNTVPAFLLLMTDTCSLPTETEWDVDSGKTANLIQVNLPQDNADGDCLSKDKVGCDRCFCSSR